MTELKMRQKYWIIGILQNFLVEEFSVSFNEYYSKVENEKNQQQDWAETMSTMQSIFSTNQTFLQSIYKETLPLEDKSFFIEAANSVNEGLWKKSKIQFNTYSTHVGYYYEGSNINNHVAGATVKAYIADAVCQIHWPDGTIHIFDKEIHAETVLPKKHEGFFISLIDEQKRFQKHPHRPGPNERSVYCERYSCFQRRFSRCLHVYHP